MKVIRFFTLKDDLVELLDYIESQKPLKYMLFGNFLEKDNKLPIYKKGSELPNLGKAMGNAAATCAAYIVCDQDNEVEIDYFESVSGEKRFSIDQIKNQHTVVLRPCGLWNDTVLISGSIGTTAESIESKKLMNLFEKCIKKKFSKVKAYYVGKLAFEMLKEGIRFACASIESPSEFDLKL